MIRVREAQRRMIEELRRGRQSMLDLKARRMPPWWPHRLCTLNPTGAGFVSGLLAGSLLVWLIYAPYTPWMRFNWITATYEPGIPKIYLDGEYEIERECPELTRARMVWRVQAITVEGQVVTYVPGGVPLPPLTVGSHRYSRTMELVDQGSPQDWHVLFIVTCPGETPETIPSQLVSVTLKRELMR